MLCRTRAYPYGSFSGTPASCWTASLPASGSSSLAIGRLIAVISPPDPKQQVIEELIAEGVLDPEELRKPCLAGITPLALDLPMSLSDALRELRDKDDR